MPVEHSGLLQDFLKAIHSYKAFTAEYTELSVKLEQGETELNEEIVQKETELQEKVKTQASDIIWNLYTRLKRAKMIIEDENFKLEDENEFFVLEEEEDTEETRLKISQFAEDHKNENRQQRRRHFGGNKDLKSITRAAISVTHSLKDTNFKDTIPELQILLICPTAVFFKIHEDFSKMEESKKYHRHLFKPLEEGIGVIFAKVFSKNMIWNHNFNKVINDTNQYLLKSKGDDVNIFSNIQENHRFNVMVYVV